MQRAVRIALVLCLCAAPVAWPTAYAEEEPLKPLDAFFSGQVTEVKRGRVTIHYDFSSDEQLKDWIEGIPFPVDVVPDERIAVVDGQLEVRGSTGARHVARWKGEVRVSCTATTAYDRDMGGMLLPPGGSLDFATFTLSETYFHRWDNQRGLQHSIIKFGMQWREPGAPPDYIGFRYVSRRNPEARLRAGMVVPLSFGIKGSRLFMDLPDFELKGRDMGKPLKVYSPGFYTVEARMLVDDVTITGKLDPEWLEEHGLELRLENPPAED
ncbi:MAG: hypothetical protein ACYTG6_00200 [Planctomycetota bacterium]|jgi:hypothetical protein